MNQRNVEALAAAFGGAFFKVSGGALDPQELLDIAREAISSRGVLVPSALTDSELDDERFRSLGTIPGKVLHADRIREYLERIAKGEA